MPILDLKQQAPEVGKIYLIDTNVWQFILSAPTNLKPYEKVYFDFFDALINLASNKLCRNKPAIYLNGLLISEIYNAWMKKHYESFMAQEKKFYDLKIYRATPDYVKKQAIIKSDLNAYKEFFKIESDLMFDPFKMLLDLSNSVDYNDHFYYHIAKARDMVIITNDQDFKYHDLTVLTNNSRLISVGRSVKAT